jgi:hypothetical protein
MEIGQVVATYGDPVHQKTSLGVARLIKKLGDQGKVLENWQVEYLDDEGHYRNCLIKKPESELPKPTESGTVSAQQ